jgi:hypothetical protein
MSLRNRARSLQKKTGLSYQQALAKLRALGDAPPKLSRQTGWSLEKCDRFLVDGHAAIDVIEVAAPADPIAQVCERLRATANARAVVVSSGDGRILAHVGREGLEAALHGVFTRSALTGAAASPVPPAVAKKWAELPAVWELDGGIVLYTVRFKGGIVVVKFQRDETSLGLVRLRTARAIVELEQLLTGDKTPGMPPVGGRGGAGGPPAETRVAVETRQAPPPPKRKPIGRKKKG